MTKTQLAQAIVWVFSSNYFLGKPHHATIAGLLFRLINDENPEPLNYLSQFDIDAFISNL